MTRSLSSRALLLNIFELARVFIDFEKYDGLIAAVRRKQILSGWMHSHFRPGVLAIEIRGQRRDRLYFGQPAGICIVGERRERRIQLVDHISKAAVGAEHH